MSGMNGRPQASIAALAPTAQIIPFPAQRAAPPNRLQTALAKLDHALADQRSVLATWRGALAELRGAMQGLEGSVAVYRGELGKLTTGVAQLHARALWLRAWANRLETDQTGTDQTGTDQEGADQACTNGQPPSLSGRNA